MIAIFNPYMFGGQPYLDVVLFCIGVNIYPSNILNKDTLDTQILLKIIGNDAK